MIAGADAVAVIGDPDMAVGFRLAGVKKVYEYEYGVDESEDVDIDLARVLDKVAKEDLVLIIINERFAAMTLTREKIREINNKKKGVIPIIIEVQDKKGPMKKEIDEIGKLIQRAIGIAVK